MTSRIGIAIFIGAATLALPSGAAVASSAALGSPAIVAQTAAAEIEFWSSVKDSADPRELEAYLKAYPEGQFAGLAKLRLQRLKSATNRSLAQRSASRPHADQRIGAIS